MLKRTTKLRMRRNFRRRQKQVAAIGASTEENLEKHLIRRLVRLPKVQRFIAGWVGLLFILAVGLVLQTRALSPKYQTVQAKAGGTYTEGIIGSFTNASPLFANSAVDSSVSRLVFNGLLKYDSENKLVGDLAESWSLDEKELNYTVILKDGIRWHDGKPLTAKDVVYTYKQIQNPETKSYLYPSWQNIKIEAKDSRTIVFTLPNSLSSFPYSLTNGIVPQHVLSSTQAAQLRSSSFNNVVPIGTGPFRFSKVEVVGESSNDRQARIALNANSDYFAGAPSIDTFIIRTYSTESSLVAAYSDKQVNAMAGLSSLPDQFNEDGSTEEFGIPLNGGVFVFFKMSHEVLRDAEVRKALVLAADKKSIFDQLRYPLVSLDEPFLRSHTGYDPALAQVTGKMDEAKKALDTAGWKVDSTTGVRSKDGKKLSFKLYSQMTSEYSSVAGILQKQWRELGVDMQVELQNDQDIQTTVALHNYDALLYGIAMGPDPDVFAYWHGTQADPRSTTRLNFSEYESRTANLALEAGRTRSDPQLRAVKYRPFLSAWRADAPALALYQPRFLYIARDPLYGMEVTAANSGPDRFTNVQNWKIREGLQ